MSSSDGTVDRPSTSFAIPDDRGKLTYLVGIFVLFAGLGMLLVPSLVSQVTYNDAEYEVTTAIAEHAESADHEYPENYVLSVWDKNRMFNYVVSGEAQEYGYAWDNYDEFRSSRNPDERFEQFDGRVGYVVVTDLNGGVSGDTAQSRLLDDLGAGSDGLAHYQLLSVDKDRSAAAFAVVPGATINGTTGASGTVLASTDIDVDGASFTYEREVTANEDGEFSVTVPYAGKYSVGDRQVSVNEEAVRNGTEIGIKN